MNFYVDSGGVVLHVEPERIFQGSANANTIRFIGAFASNLPVLVAFKLPNGVWTTPQSMGFSAQLSGVETNDGVQFNTWEYQIPQVVTENYGTVNVQFYVYGDAGGTGGQIASAMSSFVVEKGVAITLPDPTDDYQTLLTQILAVLSQIQSEIGDLPNNYVPKASGSNVAYINDQNGGMATKPFAVDVTNNALVARDGNGQIRVPLNPMQGYDAASKYYVDAADSGKLDKIVPAIYGTFLYNVTYNSFGLYQGYEEVSESAEISTVARRNIYGCLKTMPPRDGIDCTNKDYVDTADMKLNYYIDTVSGKAQKEFEAVNRDISDLYTIMGETVYLLQPLEQAYTSRETAAGMEIIDGALTTVQTIEGSTVKCDNLIPYPYAETTKTVNGVTFTDNGDGTITVNGTATANTDFSLKALAVQKDGNYFLSGCPATGSAATYILYATDGVNGYADAGAGKLINPASNNLSLAVRIYTGATLNSAVFRPMLNEGTTALPYQPYFKGLKNAYFEKIVSTGKNLIPYPYTETTKTAYGITFTDNGDGSITVNGTAEASASFDCVKSLPLQAGEYAISSNSICRIAVFSADYSVVYRSFVESGTFVLEESTLVNIRFQCQTNSSYINTIVKPMLNFGTTAEPYEPYKQSVLSLPSPVENPVYNTLDFQTGKNVSQGNTVVFDGTDGWFLRGSDEDNYNNYRYSLALSIKGADKAFPCLCNKYDYDLMTWTDSGNNVGMIVSDFQLLIRLGSESTIKTVAEWKAYLAAQYAAGDPVIVRYKTAEIQSETDLNADYDNYQAWNGGSETIVQGTTDNSEYGAENTVSQEYPVKRGGTT